MVVGLLAVAGCAASGTGGDTSGEGGAGGDTWGTGGFATGGDAGADAPPDGPIPCDGPEDCAALNGSCAKGTCLNGVCGVVAANEFGACDDGHVCTTNDTCQDGICVGGNQLACPSTDSCHLGVCDEVAQGCTTVPGNDGGQCDDGDACTGPGVCSAGICGPGSPVDCSSLDSACTNGVCDPNVGCMSMPINEGAGCDDGQGSPCTTGQCMSGLCASVPTNDGAICDDGLFCTINETCQTGVCGGGAPNPCAPPGGCFIASCDESADTCTAVPGNDGQPCDDFSPCTVDTTCLVGVCTNGTPANDGAPCDDGASCTSNTICAAGICTGGTGPVVYFADDFSTGNVGWILGPEWQIGAAQASVGADLDGNDPATDHSASADNGVAGVVLGGTAAQVNHPYYYLESPAFDTSNAPGSVILGFYRWLNSDYVGFMQNGIDVWDGTTWHNLWTGPPDFTPIVDNPVGGGPGWNFIQYDLTAYKNPGMKIRFGFEIVSAMGVYNIGSWNIDDVLVASAACP